MQSRMEFLFLPFKEISPPKSSQGCAEDATLSTNFHYEAGADKCFWLPQMLYRLL